MSGERKILIGTDMALIAGIILFSLGGVAYAAFAGVVSIPGVKPILQPTKQPRPQASTVLPSTSPQASPDTQTTASAVAPSPSPSTGEASPEPSPAPSPSPSPTLDELKAQADVAGKAAADKLAGALQLYAKQKNEFPVAATFEVGRTDATETPLKILVSEFIDELPTIPPLEGESLENGKVSHYIGYRSTDGQTAYVTYTVRITTGKDVQVFEGKPLYVVKLTR